MAGLGVKGTSDDRGIALLLVLWLLVLLSVIAVSFSGSARTQAQIARNLHDNVEARWIADGGVRLTVRRLWQIGRDEGVAVPLDGAIRFCRFREARLAISVQDVQGLIDLNVAPEGVLHSLFIAAGVRTDDAARLAASVADFRDADDRPRENGAEAAQYTEANRTYGPRNDGFRAVAEVGQVLGMSSELFARLRPALTVHSRNVVPDLAKAPPLVRAAHGDQDSEHPRQGLGQDLPANGRGTFVIVVTAETATGARFVRESVLAVGITPGMPYRVVQWGQGSAPPIDTMPELAELPPC